MHMLDCLDIVLSEEALKSPELLAENIKYDEILMVMAADTTNEIWKERTVPGITKKAVVSNKITNHNLSKLITEEDTAMKESDNVQLLDRKTKITLRSKLKSQASDTHSRVKSLNIRNPNLNNHQSQDNVFAEPSMMEKRKVKEFQHKSE